MTQQKCLFFDKWKQKHINIRWNWSNRSSFNKKTTKSNYVTAVTKAHQKSLFLKTQANAGYLNVVRPTFDEKKIKNLISKIVINLIGILYESGSVIFKIYNIFPTYLKNFKDLNVKLIHISALG